MLSAIMKIIPQIDPAALRKMQQTLQARFTKIAKGFGTGIKNVFKGGGWLGMALALIDKILNPLKDTQEAIERTLQNSADLVTNAGQFNTTPGRLYRLQALAASKGIDQEGLFNLIQKFQASVAEAKADPTAPSAVRKYVNDTDQASAFFEFIQALQRMEKNQQVLVQQSVFGEKQIQRMASFLQTDFAKREKDLGLQASEKYTPGLVRGDRLSDLADVLKVRNAIVDDQEKGAAITEGMIRARAKAERAEQERATRNIKNYENLAALNDTVNKISGFIEEILSQLGKLISFLTPAIQKLVGILENLSKSSIFRGIFKSMGKGD